MPSLVSVVSRKPCIGWSPPREQVEEMQSYIKSGIVIDANEIYAAFYEFGLLMREPWQLAPKD